MHKVSNKFLLPSVLILYLWLLEKIILESTGLNEKQAYEEMQRSVHELKISIKDEKRSRTLIFISF